MFYYNVEYFRFLQYALRDVQRKVNVNTIVIVEFKLIGHATNIVDKFNFVSPSDSIVRNC